MTKVLVALFASVSLVRFAMPASAEMPPPLPRSDSVATAGALKVQSYGQTGRPAIVFIAGYALGPWEFSREIAAYSANYTVYAITIPGFDGTNDNQSPHVQTFASDFWAFLSAQKVDKPIVIGHGLGGELALLLAEQHSDLLRAVVSIDGPPIIPGEEHETPSQRAGDAKNTAVAIGMFGNARDFADASAAYTLPNQVESSKDIDPIARIIAHDGIDIGAAASWFEEDMTMDLRGDLSKITVPVLMIAPYDTATDGKQWATPDAKKAYYQSLLTGDATANVEIVAPARHFIMLDQPQLLDQDLDAFVKAKST